MAQVELKRCNVCRRVKAVAEFSRHKGSKDGLRGNCKECRAAYRAASDRVYREPRRKELAAKQRVYYAENREKKLAVILGKI